MNKTIDDVDVKNEDCPRCGGDYQEMQFYSIEAGTVDWVCRCVKCGCVYDSQRGRIYGRLEAGALAEAARRYAEGRGDRPSVERAFADFQYAATTPEEVVAAREQADRAAYLEEQRLIETPCSFCGEPGWCSCRSK